MPDHHGKPEEGHGPHRGSLRYEGDVVEVDIVAEIAIDIRPISAVIEPDAWGLTGGNETHGFVCPGRGGAAGCRDAKGVFNAVYGDNGRNGRWGKDAGFGGEVES